MNTSDEIHATAVAIWRMSREEPPWDDLDPGIRVTVQALWDADFNPTYSGDGVSKIEDPLYEGCTVMDVAHVIMLCQPDRLVEEVRRLAALTAEWRVTDPREEHVQASYSPDTEIAVLMLFGKVVG